MSYDRLDIFTPEETSYCLIVLLFCALHIAVSTFAEHSACDTFINRRSEPHSVNRLCYSVGRTDKPWKLFLATCCILLMINS